jgi:hypothetical protein
MTLSGSGDVRPPCRPPSGALLASGCRQALRSTHPALPLGPHRIRLVLLPTVRHRRHRPGNESLEAGELRYRGRTGPGCTLGNRCGCEYGRARLPDIGIMDVGYRMHTRCACLARSSVPGIRPSASIRCQLSGARYPGPETRHPYRIPIPGRKAGIPAHALKKHAHGVCIMGDRAKGGDRISSICISNLNKAVGTLWMHPVRGPKIQTWKGLRTLSCGDGKGR